MNLEELDSWLKEEEERIFDKLTKQLETSKESKDKFEAEYLLEMKNLRQEYEKRYQKIKNPGFLKNKLNNFREKFRKKE